MHFCDKPLFGFPVACIFLWIYNLFVKNLSGLHDFFEKFSFVTRNADDFASLFHFLVEYNNVAPFLKKT